MNSTETSHHLQTTNQFVFIIGVSGSGTTLLTRIVSRPELVIGLGGNYTTISQNDSTAYALVSQFNRMTLQLWDRYATHKEWQQAKNSLIPLIHKLLSQEPYRSTSHVVYKRSSPFLKGDRYRPDLFDLFDIFETPKIIVLYRDPKASTYSSFRRGFLSNLKQCAVVCAEHLTYLAAQLGILDPDSYFIVRYEEFCADPYKIIPQLAEFCNLPIHELRDAVNSEDVSPSQVDKWKKELNASDVNFLEDFFDARRLALFNLLNDSYQER